MKNSQDNKNQREQSKAEIRLGSIVATAAHPFFKEDAKLTVPKITAWNGFTPPLMVVIEERKSRKFNETTGEKEGHAYKCIYFSNKKENYEEYWFKKRELKLIESVENNGTVEKTLSVLKKEWIGRSVILKTVDLELRKKQLYQDGSENILGFKQRSMVDFLPPLSTVIQVARVEQHKKHDEKTGDLIFKKGDVLVKLRWFNGKSLKYSEQEIPLQAIKEVESFEEITFEEEHIYIKELKKPLSLEDNRSIQVKAIPISFHDVIFQHYHYQYRFKNRFNDSWEIGSDFERENLKANCSDFDSSFDKVNILDPSKYQEKSWNDNWYKIAYLGLNNRFTQRIIFIKSVISSYNEEEEKTVPIMIEANCLLRNGKIRHFKVKRILKSKKVSDEFKVSFLTHIK